jgi:hypothetical protein
MDAVELLQKSGDEVGVGRVYGNLSTCYLENGDSSSAARYLELALRVLSEKADYTGVKDLSLTAYELLTRRGDDKGAQMMLDVLMDVEKQERAALGKDQSPTEMSSIRVASIARDRSPFSRCVPLMLMQYWLLDAQVPRRTRIVLGIHKEERGKDVYHYLAISGEPGQRLDLRIFTAEHSLKDKVKDVDLYLVTDEETLTRVALEQDPAHFNILELEGDLNELTMLAGLIGSSARPSHHAGHIDADRGGEQG